MGQMADRLRWCRMRLKDARNGVVMRARRTQPCSEKDPHQQNENSCNSADYGSPIRLAHPCAHSHQASSPNTSVEQRWPTAVAVDGQDCLAFEPCNPVSSLATEKARLQDALIERLRDNKTRNEKSLR